MSGSGTRQWENPETRFQTAGGDISASPNGQSPAQRVAAGPVAEQEVALEIHLPEVVGSVGLEADVVTRRGLGRKSSVTPEDAGDG